MRCISPDEFTQFLARIRPPEEVRTAKLYFRSYLYPDFYYVELSVDNGVYHGVLPIPNEETRRIVYYIEAIDAGFHTTRSQEFIVDVDGRCRPGPDALFFTGDEPGIVVGSTKSGLSAIPPGFRAVGIGGFITAAGAVASAGGGGIGAGVAVGAAVGAAAGVGVVVAQVGDDVTTTSVLTTTTTTAATGGGGTSTVPATTTLSGGGGASTTTSVSTTSTVASTSIPTTTTTSIPLVACFTWGALGDCRVHFDSCSTPVSAIDSYNWRMLGPPPNVDIGSTTSFTFDFSPYDPRCTGSMSFNRPIRLTVFDSDGNFAETQQNVDVIPANALKSTATEGRLRVEVQGAPGASVLIVMRDRAFPLSGGSGAVELRTSLERGAVKLELEARVLAGLEDGARLVFDLAPPLRVSHVSLGRVDMRSENRIVFQLSGNGEVVRLLVRIVAAEDLTGEASSR